MIRDYYYKEKHRVCTVLPINQQCLLLGDSILCEIYILLMVDCVMKSALNHVNLNLAKITNY